MGRIVFTKEAIKLLGDLKQSTEIVDEQGNLVAYCHPPFGDEANGKGDANVCPFTEEEMRTAFDDLSGGITTAELLEQLRKL